MPALDSVSANVRVRVRVGKHLDAATRVKRTRRSSRFWNAHVTLVSRERLFKNLVGNLIVRHSPAVLDVVPVVGVVVETMLVCMPKRRMTAAPHPFLQCW